MRLFSSVLFGLLFSLAALAGDDRNTMMFRATVLPMKSMSCKDVGKPIGRHHAEIKLDMSEIDKEGQFKEAIFIQKRKVCDDYNDMLFATHLRVRGSVTLKEKYEYEEDQCLKVVRQFSRMKFIYGPDESLRGSVIISKEAVSDELCS